MKTKIIAQANSTEDAKKIINDLKDTFNCELEITIKPSYELNFTVNKKDEFVHLLSMLNKQLVALNKLEQEVKVLEKQKRKRRTNR